MSDQLVLPRLDADNVSTKQERTVRRRQRGADKRSAGLSIVHPRPSGRKIVLGRLGILTTVAAWFTYIVSTILREQANNPNAGFRFQFDTFSYLVVVTFLTFSALMYLLARQGALYRFRDHRRVPRGELDRHFANHNQGITVLVPSYSEETQVVRATLWSAALQEFPNLKVVLLLDDPPHPSNPSDMAKLAKTRALTSEIAATMSEPAARFNAALAGFQDRADAAPAAGPAASARELELLIAEYEAATAWLEAMASKEQIEDHVDEFFADSVLMGLANELRLVLLGLNTAAAQGTSPPQARLEELYLRLSWIFNVETDTFERKKYASLSHETNKAMNLNAYITLMGHRWTEESTANGVVLRKLPADVVPENPGRVLDIPDTEYLLTLDADSILLRDYCLRLVYVLETPGNERVAVSQTPYSSFKGAPTRIERIAGASTDLQHILHQGMTYFGATFWVGANAVIRKRALEDIVKVESSNGFEVRKYIQDRTVIEDTESSIDLVQHGWTLINYPERLSYSATPPDFGSLIVQRRRWANGGLLILPKLWTQLRQNKSDRRPILFREVLLRVNYMASVAWSSLGLIFLLAYPYDSRLLSPVVVLAALPYFLAMGSDLRDCGHRFSDIFRIYGFNLVLVPVNLTGVLKSLRQALTGNKTPFVRTPKIKERTAAPALFILTPYAIVAFSLFTVWRDAGLGNWGNLVFASINAILAAAAIFAYIGILNSVVDVFLGIANWLYVSPRPKKDTESPVIAKSADDVDWEALLYFGEHRLSQNVHGSPDRRKQVQSSQASIH